MARNILKRYSNLLAMFFKLLKMFILHEIPSLVQGKRTKPIS